ncbi:GyrI-like domain-containing protein [Kribbella solani]|uniref:GyrI-like domain-containing protein n=1 Tax=Kribbella solani TaxID=236067 RepID=UPI0029AAED28|nr:GyrI-like domain-containing protein [Kribbella solani]MDX2968428.1 GyrI-like domain-containing protein [Kribbella solani]MDX3005047.1 GyrI-like domain-containing protein [Kribbella solani]
MPQFRFHSEEATAVRRSLLVRGDLRDWVPATCALVAEHLRHHGVAPNGFPFARWHALPAGVIAVEAGFPIAARITGAGLIEPSTLPAGPVLAGWHTDPDQQLAATCRLLDEWLETEGAIRAGDSWEIYHDLPACEGLGVRIEVVQPITFAHATTARR